MLQTLQLRSFSLTLQGFQAKYLLNGQQHVLQLDPRATCALLLHSFLIEGWEEDLNGEPVVLFTEEGPEGTPATGFDLWVNYVRTFPFTEDMARHVITCRQDAQDWARLQTQFTVLLSQVRQLRLAA